MEHLFFCEKQRFPRALFWLVFGIPIAYFSYKTFFKFDLDTFIPLLVITLLALFISSLKLKTIINKEGIRIKLTPFQSDTEVHSWNDIATARIRTYRPVPEYGGWGLRQGKSGRAVTLFGTCGLQIELKSGEKFLVGTFRPAELKRILRKINPNDV